ncbi:MAG: hypothetical protein L0H31_02585, partial [Nocardioidaceae bacterium]|nr:hypothetical protein [Nocardioidaceae bacterium]
MRRKVLSTSLLVPLVLIAVAFGLLLPRALDSMLIGVAAVGLLGLIGLVAAIGMERSSDVMLVLTFFFAPLTNFSLGPKPLVLASALFFLSFVLALPKMIHRPLRLPAIYLAGSV